MVLCKLASERKENHVSKKERKNVNKQTSKQKENKSACISFINVPYVWNKIIKPSGQMSDLNIHLTQWTDEWPKLIFIIILREYYI